MISLGVSLYNKMQLISYHYVNFIHVLCLWTKHLMNIVMVVVIAVKD